MLKAKSNVPVIPKLNGNGMFLTKIKNDGTKLRNQLKRKEFTDYNAKTRKEKDQIDRSYKALNWKD